MKLSLKNTPVYEKLRYLHGLFTEKQLLGKTQIERIKE